MDETSVRQRAQAHGDAVVAGDLRAAGGDLSPTAREQAGGVMGQLPRPTTAAEVASLEQGEDDWVALIRYSGEDAEVVVESRWAEVEGELKIVNLRVP
ncbi:MAG: hypothetical protein M3345_01300 [Actinomycetota bacterium]|nr:hypothetical protein [Actinomycetota bacterium]